MYREYTRGELRETPLPCNRELGKELLGTIRLLLLFGISGVHTPWAAPMEWCNTSRIVLAGRLPKTATSGPQQMSTGTSPYLSIWHDIGMRKKPQSTPPCTTSSRFRRMLLVIRIPQVASITDRLEIMAWFLESTTGKGGILHIPLGE